MSEWSWVKLFQMKKNEDLQNDVLEAFSWEPLLAETEISVTAIDGIITLTGIVDSYTKKSEAEDTAKNVAGVKAIVEKIEIENGSSLKKNDNEIAAEILNSFRWNWDVPENKLKVKVENGWVTLGGDVQWEYQKEAAKNHVKILFGLIGVTNNITINSEPLDEIEKRDIELELLRNWSIYDRDILVSVTGNKVILNGTVLSLYQKEEAERIAWTAPGVWMVDNELVIE
jgi:osmotically-inducible protein OsmY